MSTVAMANQQTRNKIHPHKFALWIVCASITMMFMAWSSAYLVREASGNFLEFRMPNTFFWNTGIIVLSSITLQLTYYYFKKGVENLYKLLLIASFFLGLAFLVVQYLGFLDLVDIGVLIDGNPAGSFVYVFFGFHALHLIGGLGAIIVALIHAFALKFNPTPKRKLRLELTLTFWHFLGFLWLYIITFVIT